MFGRKKLKPKDEMVIGVDVGSFAVKIVQMSRKEDKVTLESLGYSEVDPHKLDGVTAAIKVASETAKLTHKKVNISLNAEDVIVRFLMLPQMSYEDLKSAMVFEVERYVPFDKDDIVSDFMILGSKSTSKNMKVLLVAAKNEDINRRTRVLKGAGLEPEVMTIDSVILKNPLQLNYPDREKKTVGLINIGSKVSNINIIREATSYFMRDVQLGGDSITQLLKEKLDIDMKEAERLKCQLSLEDKEKFKIVEPALGNLLNEIYLSFDYYESEYGMAVDEIFISGGTSKLVWIADFLKENLNREITLLDPINKITLAPSIKQEMLEPLRFSLAVPVGLAMESFA